MRTIRGRLFLSLILVMILSISVTITLFSRYTTSLLRDQARTQLEIQLEKALEVLNGGQISDLDDAALELRFKDQLFTADYAVLDSKNRVNASSDPTWIGMTLPAGPSGTTGTIKAQGSDWLYTVDNIDGQQKRLMLFTPIDALRGFNRQWVGLSAVALALGSLLVFMIGLVFVWNTTRPLKRLKQAVSEFEPYQKISAIPYGESASEIGQLMHTFRSMADRIRKHHEHQTEFLHQVSHELRTPLMSIQGYALAIKDQVLPQDQAVTVILGESSRLIQMVERLLEMSRLEGTSEEWPVSTVDLRDMADQTVHIVAPFAADRKIKVTVDGLEALEAEVPPDQVFQVLLNLVHNAVRHAKSEVRIAVSERQDGWMIQVDDDGEGVPETLRETIFTRFYKGPGGGMGLGLTICREIAERIGAAIECKESSWGGASFRFYASARR
ncbi:MAG: sensor histidine kinase [Cohnella sp.]|nr:sensor histidine kinase [Cohnella sp.]